MFTMVIFSLDTTNSMVILYQLIRRYTKENDIILEPFMGSGTTLFECEKLNRKYIGFDI